MIKRIYIFLIPFLFLQVSSFAQVNMIKYQNETVIDEAEWLSALNLNQDSLSSGDTSLINAKDFALRMARMSSPYISTYYFNDTLIRYFDSDIDSKSNVVFFIDPISSKWTRYYTDKNGIIKFSEVKYLSSSDWKLTYIISVDKNDKKSILGYECYKVKIVENRESISEGWVESCTYDCYVTDELNLPFNCTELIWEKVLDKTALEVVYSLGNIPRSKEYKKAIEIKTDVNEDILILPEYFQDAIKAK